MGSPYTQEAEVRRFFVEDLTEEAGIIFLKGEEFIHLSKVLRLKAKDEVVLFNGRGLEVAGFIDSIDRDSAVIKAERAYKLRHESPAGIVIFQGLLKGDKPELIIQKATELGIKAVYFYTTSRSVPLINEDRTKGRLSRWQRAAIEAAKQCGRSVLPEIGLMDFATALKGYEDHLKILLREDEAGSEIKEVLRGRTAGVAAMIGPEGSLSPEEAEEAKGAGYVQVRLGPRILRAETAAIAVMSVLQYELGDLN